MVQVCRYKEMVCATKGPGLRIALSAPARIVVSCQATLLICASSQLMSIKYAHHETPVAMSSIDTSEELDSETQTQPPKAIEDSKPSMGAAIHLCDK